MPFTWMKTPLALVVQVDEGKKITNYLPPAAPAIVGAEGFNF